MSKQTKQYKCQTNEVIRFNNDSKEICLVDKAAVSLVEDDYIKTLVAKGILKEIKSETQKTKE